jgi:DNA-directed RNA polymerase specialized sigma24 family protein
MSNLQITPIIEPEAPVTAWIRRLEFGDAQAAQSLWQHFCSRVHYIARQRLPLPIRPGYDEEDVAISAFHSLFLGISAHRFELRDREDLWRLLLTIAERKICKRIRLECRDKRDVRRLVHESVFGSNDRSASNAERDIESLPSAEPTPLLAAEVADSCDRLLTMLPDASLKQVAILKLENYTAAEIAVHLGCTRKTVQRKLLVIRQLWQEFAEIELNSSTEAPLPRHADRR